MAGDRIPDVAPVTASVDEKIAKKLYVSEEALTLLKEVEELHLKPYSDQTGKEITTWSEGATIGYGHLINNAEWNTYKNGISEPDANNLFEQDLSPFVATIHDSVTARLKQNEFDALVLLAFNIGPTIVRSSVIKLVNDPNALTKYKDLETAWKAWNKSQGKVMQGLVNRRQCEWKIYSQGIYERW